MIPWLSTETRDNLFWRKADYVFAAIDYRTIHSILAAAGKRCSPTATLLLSSLCIASSWCLIELDFGCTDEDFDTATTAGLTFGLDCLKWETRTEKV